MVFHQRFKGKYRPGYPFFLNTLLGLKNGLILSIPGSNFRINSLSDSIESNYIDQSISN